MPIGLPSRSPRNAPSETVPSSPAPAPPTATPALKNANTGMITKARTGRQRVLHLVQRAAGALQHLLDMPDHDLGLLEVAAARGERPQLLLQLLRAQLVAQRHRERHQHAGDGGVHAGLAA